MKKMAGSATARWYDPSRGTYLPIQDSPFPNSKSRDFRPPAKNGDGDEDWILVLETIPSDRP
jgi:hypothetical protein